MDQFNQGKLPRHFKFVELKTFPKAYSNLFVTLLMMK